MTQKFHSWVYIQTATQRQQITNSKRYMHPNIHNSPIYSYQSMEATSVFITRWMDKEDMANTHTYMHMQTMEYYSAIKFVFTICSNMGHLGQHYPKWSKSKRERQILYAITYMWNLKIQQTSEQNQRRQWHPTPVLLPGESHGQRSLVGCSPWGR